MSDIDALLKRIGAAKPDAPVLSDAEYATLRAWSGTVGKLTYAERHDDWKARRDGRGRTPEFADKLSLGRHVAFVLERNRLIRETGAV